MKPQDLNGEDFDVRVARPGEGHIISNNIKSVLVTPSGETGFLRRELDDEKIDEMLSGDKWEGLICRYKGEPAGSLMICVKDLVEYGGAVDSILISRLAVMPEFQGLGVGCALYAGLRVYRLKMKLMDWPLVAYTEFAPVRNLKSERFHENNGFVPGEAFLFPDYPEERHRVWVKK